jgi:hypothetical protein
MPARRLITTAFLVALLFPGCSTGPEPVIQIDESHQGAVYLKRISDRSFQYAHPITIDPSTIALALSGIVIQGVKSAILRRSSPKVSGAQHRINRLNLRYGRGDPVCRNGPVRASAQSRP